MTRLILMLALCIGSSMAIADGNRATYNTETGRLSLSKVIIDDVDVTDSVTLELIKITPSGNYLFKLDPTTVTLLSARTCVAPDDINSTNKILVTHDVIAPSATIGSGLGTVRTFYIPTAVDGVDADGQYLTGTLTTLAEGINGDQEIRSSNLVFVLGDEKNQIVIGGVSLYAPAGATLVPGVETTRPITGGSGIYKGATGEAISTNFGDQGWSHEFYVKLK